MEHLFSPCTRLHDLIENQGNMDEEMRDDLQYIEERQLNVSTQKFRSADNRFTYADLHTMFGDSAETIMLWFTPSAAVFRDSAIVNMFSAFVGNEYSCRCRVDCSDITVVGTSRQALLETCDTVLRLVAASVVQSVTLSNNGHDDVSIHSTSLEYLMEECQSLQYVTFWYLNSLAEDQIRVLGDCSRPDLDIELKHCRITSAGTSALAEVLGRNQGPTKLVHCDIDNGVLADGLRGNGRLKILKLCLSANLEVGNQQVLAIASALRENKGLVELDLSSCFKVSDETWWGTVCDSLKKHPTLEVFTFLPATTFTAATTTPAIVTSRIQALLDMLKVNMTIHTMHLDSRYSQHKLFRGTIIPYLETNRFRPHARAIQKIRPIAYRTKVLGRALFAARTDANSIWMLLSGNAEVAFPSRNTTIATAGNLPAPATATVASTVNVAPVAATAFTTIATGSLPIAAASASASASASNVATSAATNVAPASTCQKRKARWCCFYLPEAQGALLLLLLMLLHLLLVRSAKRVF
jgi:hypothetical protein